ncbi:MAG: hypothetical protein P8188_08855 [Gemmatimonadota bacterium]
MDVVSVEIPTSWAVLAYCSPLRSKPTWEKMKGDAADTPSTLRTLSSTVRQFRIRRLLPDSRTSTWGLDDRIAARKSFWAPLITAITTMRAMTPTTTPPSEMAVMNDSSRPCLRAVR